jgi:hypothetical protein
MSASQIAKITGVSHQYPALFYFHTCVQSTSIITVPSPSPVTFLPPAGPHSCAVTILHACHSFSGLDLVCEREQAGVVTQEVEHLPVRCEALSSNPSAAKNRREQKEREGAWDICLSYKQHFFHSSVWLNKPPWCVIATCPLSDHQ